MQQVRWKNTFKKKYIIEKKANIKLKQQRARLIKLLKVDEELMSKLAKDARNVEKLLQSYNRSIPQVYSNPLGWKPYIAHLKQNVKKKIKQYARIFDGVYFMVYSNINVVVGVPQITKVKDAVKVTGDQ